MDFNRIKGKDKPQHIIRIHRINKIRLGIMKESRGGKSYPSETNYFVCPPEVRDVYRHKQPVYPVWMPIEDEFKFLRQYYCCYGGNQRIKCQGNGEQAERRNDTGEKDLIECPSPKECDFGIKNSCTSRLDLMFFLPDVTLAGCYQLSTGSINSDIDIRSGIDYAKQMFGRVSGIPMVLKRVETKIPDPKSGAMNLHWPVVLTVDPKLTPAHIFRLKSDTQRWISRQSNWEVDAPRIEPPDDGSPMELTEVPLKPLEIEQGTKGNIDQIDAVGEVVDTSTGEVSIGKISLGSTFSQYLVGMDAVKSHLGESVFYVELAKVTKDFVGGPYSEIKGIRKRSYQVEAFNHLSNLKR